MHTTLKEYLEGKKKYPSNKELDMDFYTNIVKVNDFDSMFNYGFDFARRQLIAEIEKELLPLIHTEVMEIVKIGNLDPDFEYKKEYYKGHNELQEHLITALNNYFEKSV